MYNFKKIAALGLVMTMALGSSLTAFASDTTSQDLTGKTTADKSVVGTGSEEYVDKNIMKVTMPTNDAIAKFFDYKLDPQGLIAEAKSYAGTDITGTATGIVFMNDNKGKKTISNTSDVFTITNKSSIPVDLGVKVQLTGGSSDITASTTSDFSDTAGDASKAIYLGLRATNDVERALSTTETSYDAVLATGASQYKTTWNGTAYEYKVIDNAKFKDFTFTVTGAINKSLSAATWATITGDVAGTGRTPVKKTPPVVNVKISFTPIEDPATCTLKWTTDASKNDILQVGKVTADSGKGGFVTDDYAKVFVNGREVASGFTVDEKGYLLIPLEDIYPLYKTTPAWGSADSKDKSAVKALIKSVKTTKTGTGAVTYYGEL